MSGTAPGLSGPGSGRDTDPVIEEYKNLVFAHPFLKRAIADLDRCLAPGMPVQIVLLLGPTGVGKTTAIEAMKRRCASSSGALVHVTCQPPLDGRGYRFGREHWYLIAKELGDPFTDHHADADAVARRLISGVVRRDGAASAAEYRRGVLTLLRRRGLRALILDEAQYIARVASGRTQADHLDVIKDGVDRTQTSHVLAGTYELDLMVAPNEQLARRSWVVHFPPYPESEGDAFQRIFGQLVAALPVPRPDQSWAELRLHVRDVYVGSAGCVGVLKAWLVRALQDARATKAAVVDWRLMDRWRLPDAELFKIADAIRSYRDAERSTRDDVEIALGLRSERHASSTKRRSPPGSRKPGRRSAARDEVGSRSPESQ